MAKLLVTKMERAVRAAAAKVIRSQKQADAAREGVWRVEKVPGLYLRAGKRRSNWTLRYSFSREEENKKVTEHREAGTRRELGRHARRSDRQGARPPHRARQGNRPGPGAARRDPRQPRQEDLTVREAAEAYLATRVRDQGEAWGPRSKKFKHKYAEPNWINALRLHVFPHASDLYDGPFGDLAFDRVDTSMVAEIMTAMEKAGASETAKRVQLRIEKALDYAAVITGKGDTFRNPAEIKKVRAIHPAASAGGEAEHYRAVDIDRAPAVYRALRARMLDHVAYQVWMLMIGGATRPSEALEAEWSEFDFERQVWTIPPARTKKRRLHRIPFNAIIRAVLDERAEHRSDKDDPNERLFPTSYDPFAKGRRRTGSTPERHTVGGAISEFGLTAPASTTISPSTRSRM